MIAVSGWLFFFLGLFLGALFGCLAMAFAIAAHEGDRQNGWES